MPSENEIRRLDLAMLYELRLMFVESDKENYTKQEILTLLDQIATAKK
ncbi:MAG: hypothetical protein IJU29_05240 [Oscillospiraceae bacterium]|nr:hypothetical protein [Oscillospiraceae bacterium]